MTPRLLGEALGAVPAGPLGVAVSGGGDSLALLLLLQDWAAGSGRRLAAVTVDHGLREGSAAVADAVAQVCAARGIGHAICVWRGWTGRGNLQGQARDARRRLIADWAREEGIAAVALGHTQDDQAETFLLRLARGSGVDGLAAMAPAVRAEGLLWLRPLLGTPRAALRDWLRGRGVGWHEDPANADTVFERVRARGALAPLAALGLGPVRLAATAARMARARAALTAATRALALRCLVPGPAGDAVFDPGPWRGEPEEIRLRTVAGALCWVSGARFRPRLAALEATCARIAAGRIGRGATLHGCVLRAAGEAVTLRREPAAAAARVGAGAGVWDARWRLDWQGGAGLEVGALGHAGLAQRPHWRDAGLAREALLTTPALWRGQALVASPMLDAACALRVERIAALPAPWEDAEMR